MTIQSNSLNLRSRDSLQFKPEPLDASEILSQARILFTEYPQIIELVRSVEKKLHQKPEWIKWQVIQTLKTLVDAHRVGANASMLSRVMTIFLSDKPQKR